MLLKNHIMLEDEERRDPCGAVRPTAGCSSYNAKRATVDPGAVGNEKMNDAKLTKLTDISSIKVYLTTFERLSVVFDILE